MRVLTRVRRYRPLSRLPSNRLLKKILGEGTSPSPTSLLRAFLWSLYARIADFPAFGHTSP